MMKNILLFCALFLLLSCDKTVEKPAKLIEEETMISILYDLSLLEATKSYIPSTSEKNKINSNEYIYKKYKIDSLQFAQSNRYYASDIDNYKKMYKKVNAKIETEMKLIDTLLKKTNRSKPSKESQKESDLPQVR